ncbi:EF-hand domain-containing protein [Rhizobium lusitanum]|uniref:Ca2+-binding EF-hand superfamily protein n=1 Tax=Rhizobium lusitanum TaxID=293958 RepID=A0A7X0ILL5_9HYPH|nr:EF-hand domain-containing protein [Rhizobium lusitanum]MBB6483244.1 Ca2+-binding EF-hand superfamily protein [Rhizobium lusitanum]
MTATSYSPLDKNQDGVVDAQELQQAAQSGLLSASILNDEDSDGSSDPSATDIFSGNLASMLLQMQQASAGQSDSSTSSDGSPSQSPMDQLFASLDADQDGKISQKEFVAGRPKDMSESDAENLFASIDAQNTGLLTKDQFAEGLDALKSSDTSAADMLSLEPAAGDSETSPATIAENAVFNAFLSEMQDPSSLYQNTYGQYDSDQANSAAQTGSVAA